MDKYFEVPGRPLEPKHLTEDALRRRERVYSDLQEVLPDAIRLAQQHHGTHDEMIACNWCSKVLLDVWTDERLRQRAPIGGDHR